MGFGAPVVVGHSMGGHNAILYAASRAAAIRALVVADSTPDYSQRAVDFLRSYADRPPRFFDSLDDAGAASGCYRAKPKPLPKLSAT